MSPLFHNSWCYKVVPTESPLQMSADWDLKLQQTMVEMFPLKSADVAYSKISGMLSTLGDPFTRIISPKVCYAWVMNDAVLYLYENLFRMLNTLVVLYSLVLRFLFVAFSFTTST